MTVHMDISLDPAPLEGQKPIRKIQIKKSAPSHMWLVSFTDIMALMLTFFVLLFSMSVPKQENWKGVSSNIRGEFGKTYNDYYRTGLPEKIEMQRVNFKRELSIGYLNGLFSSEIDQKPILSNVTLTKYDSYIRLSIPSNIFFQNNGLDMSDQGQRILYALTPLFSRIKNNIQVIGIASPDRNTETDMKTAISKAAIVAAVLENLGYKKNITILGVSNERNPPTLLFDNVSGRIDIIVMDNNGMMVLK